METKPTRQQESSLTKQINPELPVRSFDDVFSSGLSSIAKMKKQYGTQELKKILVVKLLELNDLLGVEFSKNQFNYIFNYLIQHGYFLNGGDIKLIFDKILKEKFYGKPTFQQVVEFIGKYIDERLQYGESLSNSEHEYRKLDENPIDLAELHAEHIRKKL